MPAVQQLEQVERRFRGRFAAEEGRVHRIVAKRPTANPLTEAGEEEGVAAGPEGAEADPPIVLAAKAKEKANLRRLLLVFQRGLAHAMAKQRSDKARMELLELVKAFSTLGIAGALLPGPQRGGDFLNNQLRGAWAEDVVRSLPETGGLVFTKFGPSMAVMPGQGDHAAVVRTFREIMLVEGKRPDLLVFKSRAWAALTPAERALVLQWPGRLLGGADEALVRKASAGIEVKTSLWHAGSRRLVNPKPLSITAKVEEVDGLAAWSDAAGLPIVFAQVLFDEMYCLSFTTMLRVIRERDAARRFLYYPGDYEVVPQRKSGKAVHQFALYERHRCAAVAMPDAARARIEVLPDGSVVPYMELGPACAAYTDAKVLMEEIERA